ncbi:TPA: hypothetical protein ACH3X2_003126 [Trebouxia sp. C0005]
MKHKGSLRITLSSNIADNSVAIAVCCIAEGMAEVDFSDERFAIVSVFTVLDSTWGRAALVNKIEYADRHNYKMSVHGHLAQSLPPVWSKIVAVQSVLQHHPHVWTVDMDSLVMNHS